MLLNILHNVLGLGKDSTGVGHIAINLAVSQYAHGHGVNIWCLDNAENIEWATTSMGFPSENIRRFPITGPKMFLYSPGMEHAASVSDRAQFDVLHQHGIWNGISRATSLLKHRNGIPNVIAPHGALEKWALKKSQWKKRIAFTLYERENLFNASCLHATGENEITDFRDFGLSNPIAFIPNGIPLVWLNSHGDREVFRRQFDIPTDKKILLFLSRITPKKGIPMLLEALQRIRKAFSEWHFVIAGVDEFGHQDEVKNIVHNRGLDRTVTFVGPLFGQIKRDAFSAADLFILPSYSEGAPIVILEALAAGVPVLATKASPWQELETHACGWWPEISINAITESLLDALNRPQEELRLMGQRGKELVTGKYTWTKSAQKSIMLYEWLLGRREMPNFVMID